MPSTCDELVDVPGKVSSFHCDLPKGHDGPHRVKEDERSIRERAKWELAQERMAQFQGKPETTAERYTENAQPYPKGSDREAPGQPRVTYEQVLADARADEEVEAQVAPEWPEKWPEEHARPVEIEETEDGRTIVYQDEGLADEMTEAEREAVLRDAEYERQRQEEAPTVYSQPERGGRPGDQPTPTQHGGEYVQERMIGKLNHLFGLELLTSEEHVRLIEALQESMNLGIQRYGTALQTFNGRDTLKDAEDEARDLFVYISALRQARDASRDEMVQRVMDRLRAAQGGGGAALQASDVVRLTVDTILDSTGVLVEPYDEVGIGWEEQ